MLINISISFIIIYFLSPNILFGNTGNIFISTLITNYLNLFSLLPFNIGYSQMIYSITFDLFSLPQEIALIISTIKQISHIIIVAFIVVFITKSFKIE
tara:strand:+ start:47 stop:340 length:294 start_codon:yes stop_codon:yes gene_type:complete